MAARKRWPVAVTSFAAAAILAALFSAPALLSLAPSGMLLSKTLLAQPGEPRFACGGRVPGSTLNCCLRENRNNCTIAPLLRANGCPERYVFFVRFANFSNSVMQFIHATLFAAAMDRTVLLTDAFNFNWSTSLEFEQLCAVHMDMPSVKELFARNGRAIRTFAWDEAWGNYTLVHGQSLEWLRMDADYFKRHGDNDQQPQLACLAQSLPLLEDPVVFIPNPFFAGMPSDMYKRPLRFVRVALPAQRAGDRFIQRVLRRQDFVGIHLRGYEGICDKWTEVAYATKALQPFLAEAKEQCDMRWEYVSRIIRDGGYDPDSVAIFLATDNQRPELTRALLAHRNVYMWDRRGDPEAGNVDARLVDMHILTRSVLFIGHGRSSLAFSVALWREADGHPSSTNALAGYRETGYLHHLFHNYVD